METEHYMSICVLSFVLVSFYIGLASFLKFFSILLASYFFISLVYNFFRTRKYFLNYYNDKENFKGYTIDYHLKSKAITKEVFDKELDRLTEELKVINKSRSEKRQTNHKDENAQIQARGIYGPECKVWEIARESVIFMGGGRAVFLQLAHPYVASGVRQHSKVVHDIQRRFYNTFHYMFRLHFGDLEVAEKSAKQVRMIHDKIFGKLDSVENYPTDSLYTAHHEGAVIWVWATLIETSILFFELCVRFLSKSEKEEYYQQQKEFVRFFGVSPKSVPATWDLFMEYTAKLWNSEILTVGNTAREMEKVLFKPKGWFTNTVNFSIKKITFTILPKRLSKDYGYIPTNFDHFYLYLNVALTRTIYTHTPGCMRYLTSYIEAENRIHGRPVFNAFGKRMAEMTANWFVKSVLVMEK